MAAAAKAAAATAAARRWEAKRPPNDRRREKIRQWRERTTAAASATAPVVEAAASAAVASTTTAATAATLGVCNSSNLVSVRPVETPIVTAAAPTAAATAAATAALPTLALSTATSDTQHAAGTDTDRGSASATPQPTPPLTRAAKKRKAGSPIQQLDGAYDVASEDGDDRDPGEKNEDSRCASTYAEVAALGTPMFPPVRLPTPINGLCPRCNASPVYPTGYGLICEMHIRGLVYYHPDKDLYLKF